MIRDKSLILLVSLLTVFLPLSFYPGRYSVTAQTDTSNFLTYTNTDYGFTMKYPSNWIVDDKNISRSGVKFSSSDHSGNVGVIIGNLKPNETSLENMSKFLVSHHLPGLKILEINTNNYFLGGHPAIRMIDIMSFGGPAEPGVSEGVTGDQKQMGFVTLIGSREYDVFYAAIPPERFPDYLQTAQTMIDSFQIISKQ